MTSSIYYIKEDDGESGFEQQVLKSVFKRKIPRS